MPLRPEIERVSDRLTALLVSDGVRLAGWLRYSLAVFIVALAVGLRVHMLPVDGRFVFFTLYPAVILCAVMFGAGAGIAAVAASALGAGYYLMPPYRTFALAGDNAAALAVYVVCGLLICALAQQLRRAATRLQRSERTFRSLYDSVDIGIVLVDLQGNYLEANDAYQRMSGYSLEELRGLSLVRLTPPEFHDIDRQQAAALTLTGHCGPFETQLIRKDGRCLVLRASGSRITTPEGVDAIWALARDITEKRRMSAALERNEAQLRGIFTALSEGLVVQQADGSIVDANPAAEAILGLSRSQLLGKTSIDPRWHAVRDNGSPLPGEEHPAMVTLRTGQSLRNQIMGVRSGLGSTRWISVNSQLLPATGDPRQQATVVATFSDITEQRESYRRIRELALRVDAVREEERRSVAQLLHEGIAQDLFAAKLRLRQLLAKARVGDGTAQACSEIGDALDKCMEATRQMANSLRPAALSHMALPEALTEHARYFGDLTGLKISVTALAPFPPLRDAVQLIFFRAAQELLTNVVKHARASSIAILLDADASTVSMDVVDNGVGIEMDNIERKGALGLLGLRERISALGGELRLRRNPDVGTTVSVRLPRPLPVARLVS